MKMRLQDVKNLLESLDLLQQVLDLQNTADTQSFMDDSGECFLLLLFVLVFFRRKSCLL